jgi:hypothetical protein
MHTQSNKLPHFSFIELTFESEREREVSLTSPPVETKGKRFMLCRKFLIFRKSFFFDSWGVAMVFIPSLPNTRTLRPNNSKQRKENTKLLFDNGTSTTKRRRRVREVFIDFPICLNPEKKVFYFRFLFCC